MFWNHELAPLPPEISNGVFIALIDGTLSINREL